MTGSRTAPAPALTVEGEMLPRFAEILTADALGFVADLAVRFGARRAANCCAARAERYASGAAGATLGFRMTPPRCEPTRPGAWPRPRRAWPTGDARSPGRPRAR